MSFARLKNRCSPYFASLALHRAVGTFDLVNRFIAVSGFVRDTHAAAGLPPDRIAVKPNFAWPAERREGSGEAFAYLGRLSAEKGVDTLLRAWRPELGRLLIVGDGPEAPGCGPWRGKA